MPSRLCHSVLSVFQKVIQRSLYGSGSEAFFVVVFLVHCIQTTNARFMEMMNFINICYSLHKETENYESSFSDVLIYIFVMSLANSEGYVQHIMQQRKDWPWPCYIMKL